VKIRFYETPSGQRPVEKYLAGLESTERAEVVEALDAAERYGLGEVETRAIEGKLWEIKVPRHRVFYVLLLGPEMVLLHAYKKQSQKGAQEGDRDRPEADERAAVMKTKRGRVSGNLDEFIANQKAKDPFFAEKFEELSMRRKIGRIVRLLREKKSLTQGELAERAGTKQPSIARLEAGKVIPRLDLLEKIASSLGLSLDVRFVAPKRMPAGKKPAGKKSTTKKPAGKKPAAKSLKSAA
jgi:transcriptional regulator with XRE-family HTH domain/phage-related protein